MKHDEFEMIGIALRCTCEDWVTSRVNESSVPRSILLHAL
jgi:hypothetical protein